jgi:DNA-directed RNA polymerase sigma subunit (sigma70/sigma32)
MYRDNAMLVMYQNGSTLDEVAREFGLSRQRVHQILVAQECQMRRSGPRTWVKP